MALLTTPLVLNDGTTDHTFESRGPLTSLRKNQTGGDYIEEAAALADDSKIVVLHDNSKPSAPRHLLQYTNKKVPASATDGVRQQKTFNMTFVGSEEFSDAEVLADFTLFLDLLAETGLINDLRKDKL